MKCLYHVYAIWQPAPGATMQHDGLLQVDNPIRTEADYIGLKAFIADTAPPLLKPDPRSVTICSLMLLEKICDA